MGWCCSTPRPSGAHGRRWGRRACCGGCCAWTAPCRCRRCGCCTPAAAAARRCPPLLPAACCLQPHRHTWTPCKPPAAPPAAARSDACRAAAQVLKATIQRFWWDTIRQPATIRSLLQLVYARPQAIDDALLERIVAATHRPDALDAFTSILLSPRTALTFNEMLAAVGCPVLLAYGRDDPWCARRRPLSIALCLALPPACCCMHVIHALTQAHAATRACAAWCPRRVVPIWGQRLKRVLPQAQYLELSPAGHCPHHEAPAAINSIISTWLAAVEAGEHDSHELVQVRVPPALCCGGSCTCKPLALTCLSCAERSCVRAPCPVRCCAHACAGRRHCQLHRVGWSGRHRHVPAGRAAQRV